MRVKHLTDRLSHVRSLGPLPVEVSTSAIDGNISRLAEIERKFISVPACDGLLSVQQDSILEAAATNLTAEATYVGCQQDPSTNLSAGPVLNADFQPTVNTGICIQSNSDSSTPFRPQQTSYNTDNSVAPPLAPVSTTPFIFSVFNKFTHTVEGLLRELPVVDGLEVKTLLDFFRKVIKIRTLCPISERALFEVIYPNCREPLCARVSVALNSNLTFAQFHGDVLRFPIPKRLFEKLKQDVFGRLQREDESFPSYVNSVEDAAVVLQLPVSEKEIVSNIVEGLSPAQRSRFVFQLPPDNLGALDRLCVCDQNILFSDELRSKDTVPSSSVPPVQSTSDSDPPTPSFSSSHARNSVSRTNTCFYCKKAGHIKKDCPKWRASSRQHQAAPHSSGNSL
jgi:hypothetical protein